jgi:hypothetical protein
LLDRWNSKKRTEMGGERERERERDAARRIAIAPRTSTAHTRKDRSPTLWRTAPLMRKRRGEKEKKKETPASHRGRS